jgi:serine/threonine-protein kinase
VVSTAAAYLAVAFVLLQLGEILFPAFDLGPQALRLLFAGLLALFPVVIALSWIYDVTGGGLRRTDPDAEAAGAHPLLVGSILAGAVVLGAGGWYAVRMVDPVVGAAGAGAATAARLTSIAVLPFTDLSEARDQGYMGDGLAEEVLNLLAGIDGLQVAARTSSFAFRDNDDIREIGARLGVSTILEGSVRRSERNVRITAQLIDVSNGFHVWSETFDREVDDLFAVQDEIARAIATQLLGELGLNVDLEGHYVAAPEAQDAYWRGRAQWGRRDAAGLPEAIELFSRAIEIDSLYAAAYAGLADSWALLPQFVPGVDARDALDRAEASARRAIELDDGLAEPHASLGLVLALRQDRVGALAELGRAIALNPSYAPALHWRANVLAEMGRLADAVADAERAASVDPLSPAIATDFGNILLWSGDPESAADEFERAQRLDFGYAPAVFGAALVALEEGEPVALQMALTQWTALTGLPVPLAGELATGFLTYQQSGSPQPVPATLVAMGQGGRLSSGTVAAIHGLLGQRDGAISWLRQAVADGSWVDQFLRVNPAYDAVRDDPAFVELLLATGA